MKNFEILVRGVILKEGKILLCKGREKNYWYFPGGHVEFGEKIIDALRREIHEELRSEIKSLTIIGASENIYHLGGEKTHEFNYIFETDLKQMVNESQEDHLEVKWVKVSDLEEEIIMPQNLKKSIIKWIKNKKPFFLL